MGVGVQVVLEHVDDLSGIEPQIARIAGEHAQRIARTGDALPVSLLKGHNDLLFEPQDSGSLRNGEVELTPTLGQILAKTRLCHLLYLPVKSFGLTELLQPLRLKQHVTRLGAIGGTHNALVLEHVHDAASSSVAHLEAPLEGGGGT